MGISKKIHIHRTNWRQLLLRDKNTDVLELVVLIFKTDLIKFQSLTTQFPSKPLLSREFSQ